MLTKTKNIHKQSNIFFFQKFKKHLSIWTKGSNIQNLKEIRALGSEKIAARTDKGWQTKLPYHDLCWQSQAELKIDSQAELKIVKKNINLEKQMDKKKMLWRCGG